MGTRRRNPPLIVSAALISTAVQAQDPAFDLGEIVVSGDKPRVVEEVGTVDEVTAEDIHRSGARDLNEALKLLPGLYVRTGGDGTPRIDIRGLRTRQIILLLDGVPINSAIDGQFDPSAIDVENIERIKITRGTSSLLYGSGGTAGVINIITKAGGERFQGHALTEFGGNGDGVKHGQISAGTGGEDWHSFMSASGFHQDSFHLSDDYNPVPVTGPPTPNNFQPQGQRINSDRDNLNLYANSIWQGLPGTEIGISGSYKKGSFGIPPDVRDFTGTDADPFATRSRFERVNDFEGFSLNLTGQHKFQAPLTIRPTIYFNRLDELDNNYDNANFNTRSAAGAFGDNTRSDILGGSLVASYDFAAAGLSSVALNCRNEQWHDDGFQIVGQTTTGTTGKGKKKTTTSTTTNITQPTLVDESDDICSVSYEHELRLYERLGLVGGVGYNWQTRTAGNNDDVSYLVGTYYDVFEHTRLHFNHSRQIRFPTLTDLFEPGRANPGLKPEVTKEYETGVTQTFAVIPASAGITFFRTDANNFIEADSNGVAQNIDRDRFQGIELAGEIAPLRNLQIRAGYTFMDSRNLSAGVTDHDLQNRPRHRVTTEVNYLLPFGVELYASYYHVDGSVDLSKATPTVSRNIGDYDLFDLKVEKSFGDISIFGRALNLFDENYMDSGGFPSPGRTIFFGGELHFGS